MRWKRLYGAAMRKGDAALVAVLRDADLRPALGDKRTTTLLLHGELDPLITAEKIETQAQSITGAKRQPLPTGHFPPVEAPEAFAKALIRFMAQ